MEENILPTFLPNNVMWSIALKRPISGMESLAVIGFDPSDLDVEVLSKHKVSDTLMRELGGNAFTGQVVAALLLALLANLQQPAIPNALKAHMERYQQCSSSSSSNDEAADSSGALDAICALVG